MLFSNIFLNSVLNQPSAGDVGVGFIISVKEHKNPCRVCIHLKIVEFCFVPSLYKQKMSLLGNKSWQPLFYLVSTFQSVGSSDVTRSPYLVNQLSQYMIYPEPHTGSENGVLGGFKPWSLKGRTSYQQQSARGLQVFRLMLGETGVLANKL